MVHEAQLVAHCGVGGGGGVRLGDASLGDVDAFMQFAQAWLRGGSRTRKLGAPVRMSSRKSAQSHTLARQN